ncbi:MAG: hypothetical protein M1817_003258 [Caeruleum heppii]|nr:MAG: hypothetical protein M1817_003258 [Caeruleum heppii]
MVEFRECLVGTLELLLEDVQELLMEEIPSGTIVIAPAVLHQGANASQKSFDMSNVVAEGLDLGGCVSKLPDFGTAFCCLLSQGHQCENTSQQ